MAIKILRPHVLYYDTGFAPAGYPTEVECCDPGDNEAHDDDTSYVTVASGGSEHQIWFTMDTGFTENMAAVNSVKVISRQKYTLLADNAFILRIANKGSTTQQGGYTYASSYATTEWDCTNSRPGGGVWSEEDFRDSGVYGFRWGHIRVTNGPAIRITSLYVKIDYVPVSAKIEAVRRILSRRLRLFRRPLPIVEIQVGPEFINVPIGEIISLSHFAGPYPGWGTKKWERRSFVVLTNDLDHDSWRCRLTLVDIENFEIGLWDVCQSKVSATSARDGIATLDAGATRSFLRNSAAYIESPAENDNRIVLVAPNVEKNSLNGLLLEGSSTNRTLNSCFKDGVAGSWISEGTGVNGSAIANDTGDLLWDSTLTANSCKITAGNPLGGTECGIKQTTGTIPASTKCSISVTHKDDSGVALAVRIQRAVDSWYYNAGSSTWQAAAVWNDLTVRAVASRDDIRNIDVGGTNTTITYKIAAENTAGQINHVYDCQFEDKSYPTSRILTQAATVTREDDEFWWSNTIGARTLYPDRHTAFAVVVPLWSTADLPTGAKKTLWYTEVDSNNKIHVYYDEATETWRYDHVVAGVTNTAYKAQGIVAGTAYKIAIRKTSTLGEFDLTAHTISIYIDGVKGTDDVTSAFPQDATLLHVGRSAVDTDMLDSNVRHIYIAPFARRDEAIARLSL